MQKAVEMIEEGARHRQALGLLSDAEGRRDGMRGEGRKGKGREGKGREGKRGCSGQRTKGGLARSTLGRRTRAWIRRRWSLRWPTTSSLSVLPMCPTVASTFDRLVRLSTRRTGQRLAGGVGGDPHHGDGSRLRGGLGLRTAVIASWNQM